MKETQENIPLAIATVVLGIVVGFSSLILSAILDLTEHYFLNFNETNKIPVNINIFPLHRFASVLIGGIIATGKEVGPFLRVTLVVPTYPPASRVFEGQEDGVKKD